jgi:3',5'-cyclic AMP phosphodiesterase CpdA
VTDRSTAGGEGAVVAPGFVLAHLSDPHVPSRLDGWPTALLNKRVFGYLSWRLRRVRIHRREVLDALVRDLAERGADHVAVTGDIVNIALPKEFTRAADWLRTLNGAGPVTVVPGNHDAYVAVSWERSWAAWHEFMHSDGHEAAEDVPPVHRSAAARGAFPFVRRRGPLALIGLSTAVPTAPGRSSGHVGARQLERLAHHLRTTGDAGLFRVVLLHHPPRAEKAPRHKQLTDAEAFVAVIAGHGAELILHGHEHRFRYEELAGPNGRVPVFGVPSASMLPRGDGGGAGQYHLHHIRRHTGHWSLETEIRSYSRAHGRFVESHLRRLLLPAADPPPATGGLREPALPPEVGA